MSGEGESVGRSLVPLGSIGSFRRGQGGTKADARTSGVPCVRYGDLYTKHDAVIRDFTSFIAPESVGRYTALQYGDVVFAASGETHEEIGMAAAYCGTSPAYAGGDTIIFRPHKGHDPKFLGYAVNSQRAARFKARFGQGSSVIHIAARHLQQLEIYAPGEDVERRIAEILDTIDEAIRRTAQVIAKLQQMKQGLLHDLLTRGINENGELRDPERHPEQFEDSSLGRKPKDWGVSSVAAEFAIASGITLGPHRRPRHHPVPYLRVANVFRDRLDLTDISNLEARPIELVGKTLGVGDLLVVEGHANPREIGRCAIATKAVEGITFQNHLFRLRPTTLDPIFSLHWMNGASTRRYWRRMCSTSSGLNTINRTLLSGVPVLVPSPDEQRSIAHKFTSIAERTTLEKEEADKLRSLKHGLMDDLLTGRVRVTQLEEVPA